MVFGFKKKPKGNELSDEDRKRGQERSRQVRSMKAKLKDLELAQEVYYKQEELNQKLRDLALMRREKELDILEREKELNSNDSENPEDQMFMQAFNTIIDKINSNNKIHNNPIEPLGSVKAPIVQRDLIQDLPSQENNQEDQFTQADDFIEKIESMPKEKYSRLIKMLERFT